MLTTDLILRIIAAFAEAFVLVLKDAAPADRAALLERHNDRMEFFFGWLKKLREGQP